MKIRHQPRIPGVTRLPGGSSLPPVVEQSLRDIARSERRSVSWVKAEVICAYFGLDAATGKILPGQQERRKAQDRLTSAGYRRMRREEAA